MSTDKDPAPALSNCDTLQTQRPNETAGFAMKLAISSVLLLWCFILLINALIYFNGGLSGKEVAVSFVICTVLLAVFSGPTFIGVTRAMEIPVPIYVSPRRDAQDELAIRLAGMISGGYCVSWLFRFGIQTAAVFLILTSCTVLSVYSLFLIFMVPYAAGLFIDRVKKAEGGLGFHFVPYTSRTDQGLAGVAGEAVKLLILRTPLRELRQRMSRGEFSWKEVRVANRGLVPSDPDWWWCAHRLDDPIMQYKRVGERIHFRTMDGKDIGSAPITQMAGAALIRHTLQPDEDEIFRAAGIARLAKAPVEHESDFCGYSTFVGRFRDETLPGGQLYVHGAVTRRAHMTLNDWRGEASLGEAYFEERKMDKQARLALLLGTPVVWILFATMVLSGNAIPAPLRLPMLLMFVVPPVGSYLAAKQFRRAGAGWWAFGSFWMPYLIPLILAIVGPSRTARWKKTAPDVFPRKAGRTDVPGDRKDSTRKRDTATRTASVSFQATPGDQDDVRRSLGQTPPRPRERQARSNDNTPKHSQELEHEQKIDPHVNFKSQVLMTLVLLALVEYLGIVWLGFLGAGFWWKAMLTVGALPLSFLLLITFVPVMFVPIPNSADSASQEREETSDEETKDGKDGAPDGAVPVDRAFKAKCIAVAAGIMILFNGGSCVLIRNAWNGAASSAEVEAREQAEASCRQGKDQLEQKRFDQAIESFSAAVAADESFADAYAGRGEALLQRQRYSQAIDDCSAAIELDSRHEAAYRTRGLAYLGRYMSALTNGRTQDPQDQKRSTADTTKAIQLAGERLRSEIIEKLEAE